jgi:hypothetical protein
MSDLITVALVRLDADLGTEKHDVIRALAGIVADAGRTTDPDQLADDAITRETGTGAGASDPPAGPPPTSRRSPSSAWAEGGVLGGRLTAAAPARGGTCSALPPALEARLPDLPFDRAGRRRPAGRRR